MKKTESNPILDSLAHIGRDEGKAVALLEEFRWAASPVCALCGSANVYKMTDRATGEREKNHRWRCRACGERYTVRTGTVFEETRIPLWKWTHAYWRACASKKGVSALQIAREIQVSYKSALFLMHRVRYAMATDWGTQPPLSGIVEADDTFTPGKPRKPAYPLPPNPNGNATRSARHLMISALVERGGRARIEKVMPTNYRQQIDALVAESVDPRCRFMTDEGVIYQSIGNRFGARHTWTTHNKRQYAKPDGTHSNTAESIFSLIKRGLHGTFHSVSKHHLHRYLAEFEYRWNTRFHDDGERTALAVRRSVGKRLSYLPLPA